MKKIISLTFLALLMAFSTSAFAQNGNVVVSSVKIYDLGDGTGLMEVHIAGNQVDAVSGAIITLEGDIGSRSLVSVPVEGSGNQAMITTNITLPRTTDGSGFLEATIVLRNRFSSSLDWTYSARSKPRRPTGI